MSFSVDVPVRRRGPELSESSSSLLPPEPRETKDVPLAYVRLLWNQRRRLSRVALYALVASTLVAFLIPVQYESTTRLMPPDKKAGSGLAMAAAAMTGAAGGLGELASDFLGSSSTTDLTVGILDSRTVQDRLIKKFDLQKVYSIRRMEDTRKRLADKTSVVVDRKSQIISVTVSDRTPQRSAALAQAYTEELNRVLAELNTSSAHRERVFLEDRLRAVNQDLEAAEQDFSQFASKNTAIDIKEQGRAMVAAAATLQGELIAAQSEYEGLNQIYTSNNVRVRSLKARIDELQHQLEKVGGKGESTSLDSSQQPSDGLYPSIRRLPLLGVAYADLYRRTKIQEAVLETLTKEYEMAKVQEVKELPTVKVLDPADLPDKKSFPPRLFIIFFATLLAATLAVAWTIGCEVWQDTEPGDPRKIFAQEVFSSITARLPRISRTGDGEYLVNGKIWRWGNRKQNDLTE